MWICLNDAFVSIVNDPSDYRVLQVRARQKEHLFNIFQQYDFDHPGADSIVESIQHSPDRDYQWRVFVPRDVIADIIRNEVENIYYNNFKDSVKDHKMHSAYKSVWATMYDIEVPSRQSKGMATARDKNMESINERIGTDFHPGGTDF